MKQLVFLALLLSSAAHAQVRVADAWVRGTVPGQTTAAAYMKIESPEPVSLVGASSTAARSTEVHQTVMEGGMMKMLPVAAIEIGPGKPAELKPGGYHVMLVDIVKPLAKGDTVPLRLRFRHADGKTETLAVKATVREPGTTGSDMHHHQ